MYLESSITKTDMKDPIRKFEEELHRHEVRGLKKKIKKLKKQNLGKFKQRAAMKKQVLQKQITLVLLIFSLLWFLMLVMIWLN